MYQLDLTPSDLKKWMIKHERNVLDVASATGFHPATVERFLNRETKMPHKSFMTALKNLVEAEPVAK